MRNETYLETHIRNTSDYGGFMCFNETQDFFVTHTANRQIGLFMCPTVICLYLYVFYESIKKKKWIREPILTTRQWDQTYCKLSLWLVQLVQLLIPVNVIYLIL